MKNQREYQRSYRIANRLTINAKRRERYSNDRYFRAGCRCRSLIRQYLRENSDRYIKLIGCSPNQLQEHIQSQFKEGMNWSNHSNRLKGWSVDHIETLTSAKTVKGIKELCHYTNLRPLWTLENLAKGFKSADSLFLANKMN